MANHGAAALLIIASLLVAANLAGVSATLTVHHDMFHGGYVVKAAAAAAETELTCNKVRGVQAGESCFTVAVSAGLTQEQFLAFNPNINCESVFVGQWVCLDATAA